MINMIATELLMLIVSLVACVVIVTRWKKLGPASSWALSGFGLMLLLGLFQPVAMILNSGMLGNSTPLYGMWAYPLVGIALSLLHAIAYVLLLVAIFAGRSTSTSADLPAAGPQ
jgi:hypothetical protein